MKRVLGVVVLIALAVWVILIYWSQHLYYKAKKSEESENKIEVLEKAGKLYSLNNLVFYELGKSYFDLGLQTLNEDSILGQAYIQKSIQNFERSIQLNPASRFTHFNHAQAVLYMSYLAPSGVPGGGDLQEGSFDGYKKAALLAGHNSQIFYEVAKLFLSKWNELPDEEREFTIEILKKIVSGKDRARLQTLMNIWAMNVKDYALMEEILPEDTQIYRIYTKFLGEKSLSLEERQRILADGEFMEFERAKEEYSSGENVFLYLKVRDASRHYQSCLDILKGIRFYQNLTDGRQINHAEFNRLRKNAYLKLAKCRIAEGKTLKEVEGYLRSYLALEDNLAVVEELESFLRARGLISGNLDASLDNLDNLSFQMFLSFKQNQYREIIRVGSILKKSFIVVPEDKKKGYVEVLRLVGDSYQKVDYVYDAAECYQMALEIDPDNLETLFKARQNHERLSNEEEIRKINKRIEKLLSPAEIDFKGSLVRKGRSFSRELVLDAEEITLELEFRGDGEEPAPLITVVFNGKVVWEDYLHGETISIPLAAKVGKNTLVVLPVNREVRINGLRFNVEGLRQES